MGPSNHWRFGNVGNGSTPYNEKSNVLHLASGPKSRRTTPPLTDRVITDGSHHTIYWTHTSCHITMYYKFVSVCRGLAGWRRLFFSQHEKKSLAIWAHHRTLIMHRHSPKRRVCLQRQDDNTVGVLALDTQNSHRKGRQVTHCYSTTPPPTVTVTLTDTLTVTPTDTATVT